MPPSSTTPSLRQQAILPGCIGLAWILLTPAVPVSAGGNPVDDAATPVQRQLMVMNGGGAMTAVGDFVSSADGLDSAYTFGIEVPVGTSRLVVELFDPDVVAGSAAVEEADERDVLEGTRDTSVRYLLFDPDGSPANTRFGLGDGTGPADNAWISLFDSDSATSDGPATFADHFETQSYGNQDGTSNWSGNWIESNELGTAGPSNGQLQVTAGGALRISNAGDTGSFLNKPGIQRGLNLSAGARQVLRFDWTTEGVVEDDDAILVEASPDGGTTWLGLGLLNGFASGASSGQASFDLSAVTGPTTVLRFRVFDLFAGPDEAFLIDNVEINTTAPALPTTPKAGHWRLVVEMSSAVNARSGQQDDRNAFALRAHDGDPSAAGTEINIYSETYLPIGVNQDPAGRTYSVHPYITGGCELRVNDFDFDFDSGLSPNPGSWSITSRQGVFGADSTLGISQNNEWLSTSTDASDYGAWDAQINLQSPPNGLATLYFGSFEANDPNANGDGTPGPSGSPEPGSFRIYLPTDAGGPPGKPFMTQAVEPISGPNPPVMGETTRYAIKVQMAHPPNAAGPLDFDPGQGIFIEIPGMTADADICFADLLTGSPILGSIEEIPTGCGGRLHWSPGTMNGGDVCSIVYFVDVTPSNDTWSQLFLTGSEETPEGTHALFVDETGSNERLGNLCGTRLDSGVALEPDLTATRTPSTTMVPEGGLLEYSVRLESFDIPEGFQLQVLTDDHLSSAENPNGDVEDHGDCSNAQLMAPGSTYDCSYSVTIEGNAGELVTSLFTAGGNVAGPVAQDRQMLTIINAPPAFTVDLAPDSIEAASGDPVSFVLTVGNTSFSDPMSNLRLSDSLDGADQPSDCIPPGLLPPGDTWQCTFEKTFEGPGGTISYGVDVTANDDEGSMSTVGDSVMVALNETDPPVVSFVTPMLNHLWRLSSPDGHPDGLETETVILEILDSSTICQISIELLTDEGVDNPETGPWIPLTIGEFPSTTGNGAGCGAAIPLDTDNLWTDGLTIPQRPPSGIPGSRYRLEATVMDLFGNATSISSQPFFIDQRSRFAVETLILTHRSRLATTTEPTSELDELDIDLWDLADHFRVNGVLVDLELIPELEPLYAIWDQVEQSAPATSYQQANALISGPGGIREWIVTLDSRYPSLRHLLIVGDDRVLPFTRVDDNTHPNFRESNYGAPDIDGSGSAVENALSADQFLSDDPLATLPRPAMPPEGDPSDCREPWSATDFGVGRLVEDPLEIRTAIADFLALDGTLDLAGLDPASGHKVQITGYDHLLDGARQAEEIWLEALELAPDYVGLAPFDNTLTSSDWGLSSIAGRRQALLDHLSGNGATPYGILHLNSHATHYQEGVPAASLAAVDGLDAICLYDPDALACDLTAGGPGPLTGRFVFSLGCHGGLSIPGSEPGGPDNALDLPQTHLARGALGYLASTGYTFGLFGGVGYGERLGVQLNREIARGGNRPLADIVRDTKRRYFLEDHCYDVYDRKTVEQLTLYGFPMAEIITGLPQSVSGPGQSALLPPVTPEKPTRTDTIGGVTYQRKATMASTHSESIPNLLIESNRVSIDPSLYVKYTADGDSIPETSGCPHPVGCYFAFDNLERRASDVSDLPIQPYTVSDRRYEGVQPRGAMWLGGEYLEEEGWRATLGTLVTNDADIPSGLVTSPRHSLLGPVGRSQGPGSGSGSAEGNSGESMTLLLTLGEALRDFTEIDPTQYNRQRLYLELDVEAYFYGTSGPGQDDREGPVFGPGPFAGNHYHRPDDQDPQTIHFAVPITDSAYGGDGVPEEVWRVLVVYNDGTSLDTLIGRWIPFELSRSLDSDCPGLDPTFDCFTGSLTFAAGATQVTYALQAVDRKGNTTWLDWATLSTPESGIDPEIPDPIDVGPAFSMVVTPSTFELPEPGGEVTIEVDIRNRGGADLVLHFLSNGAGSLDGVGSCALPQELLIGQEYHCAYDISFMGDVGAMLAEIVRARAMASDDRLVPADHDFAIAREITITNILPALVVDLTSDPANLDEPGGTVTYTVEVGNVGLEALELTSLVDGEGSLDGLGSCQLSPTFPAIAVGESYSCTFDAAPTGNGGDVVERTVTATVRDDDFTLSSDEDSATVTFNDVLPTFDLMVSGPSTIDENADTVSLDLELTNTSVEPITITTLTEAILGDLTALGCTPPSPSLAVGETLECSFTRDVMGQADLGDTIVVTVDANAQDDEFNVAAEQTIASVTLAGTDWGDAPFETLLADDGARHTIVPGFFLGMGADAEVDGQASADADGDDTAGRDDDDGIFFTSAVIPGSETTLEILATLGGTPGVLDAWIDWDLDGDWDDAGERIFTSEPLTEGINLRTIPVPASAPKGTETVGRFRLSNSGVSTTTGLASDGEVEDHQIVIVDIIAPIVTLLELDPGGPLVECTSYGNSPRNLKIGFSEAMNDPPGDAGSSDVTNPASYQLVAAGADRKIDTTVCGNVSGDDQPIPITLATYDPVAKTVLVQLDGGQLLADELYRVNICDSLTDLSGNALDGDEDSDPGGELARTFRVDAFNLFANPHLDCDMGGWVETSTNGDEIDHDPAVDYQNSVDSGSVSIQNLGSQDFSIGQCINLIDDARLGLRSSLRLLLPLGSFPLEMRYICELYDAAGCTGSLLVTRQRLFPSIGDSDGAWIEREYPFLPVPAAASALCSFDLTTGQDQDFTAHFDALFAGPIDPTLFRDGFESGDTSEWSNAVP